MLLSTTVFPQTRGRFGSFSTAEYGRLSPGLVQTDKFSWLGQAQKVRPDLRVADFLVSRGIQKGDRVAMLMAGPLADRVFEPLLQEDGALAGSVGSIIGTGPGRGIALMFIILGGLSMVFTLIAFLYPRLRNLEDEIPDYDEIDDEALAPAPAATPA